MIRIQVLNLSSPDLSRRSVMSFDISGTRPELELEGIESALDYIRRSGPGVLIQITYSEEGEK